MPSEQPEINVWKEAAEYRAEARRKRIATLIAADIMRGRCGQAHRLVLVVNGQHDSAWTHDALVDRIMISLRETDAE